MKNSLCICLSVFFILNIEGRELLSIPLNQPNSNVVYSLPVTKKCNFSTSSNVEVRMDGPSLSKKSSLDFFEKIYFKIKDPVVTKSFVRFKISASTNLSFQFSLKNCSLKKTVIINKNIFEFDSFEVIYKDDLGPPVLHKLYINNREGRKVVYANALSQFTPFYEFIIGMAISARNNLRPNNEKPFLKEKPIIEPYPAFIFRYGPAFLNREGVGSAIFGYSGATLIALGTYDGEPYKSPGVTERKKGVFLGALLQWEFIELKYMRDWVKHKRGSELKLSFKYEFRPSLELKLTPYFYLQAWNRKYNNYYFSVSDMEAESSPYPQYSLKDSVNFSLMNKVEYFIGRYVLFSDFGVKFLSPRVYNSPIVLKKYELRMTLGIGYEFY